MDILDELISASGVEPSVDEAIQLVFDIKDSSVVFSACAIPDIDAMTKDQLLLLQEETEERFNTLLSEEPETEDFFHDQWETNVSDIEHILDQISARLEELLERNQ